MTVLRVLVCAIFVMIASACTPPAEKDFQNFQERAKKTVDPDELQKWAVSIIENSSSGSWLNKDQLPKSLKQIDDPNNITALVSPWGDTKQKAVIIYWGGGFATWGLIVGGKEYSSPHENSNSRIVPWVPGIYFFRGKH